MDERVAEDAAEQSLNGKGMLVVQAPGQQSQKRRHEDEQGETAEQLRDRRSSLARAEPAATQQGQHERNQQNGDAIGLQKNIANQGACHADPIVRRLGAGSLGSGIQRRIESGVRDQGERKEGRGGKQQQSHQLIEPAVPGRNQNADDKFHQAETPAGKDTKAFARQTPAENRSSSIIAKSACKTKNGCWRAWCLLTVRHP